MTENNSTTIPARHIVTGDQFWGCVVSQTRNYPDGSRELKLVLPYTTHKQLISIREQDLDAVTYPVTTRGDEHAPSSRNILLGLPVVPPAPRVEPTPVAVYPVGTLVKTVLNFDRSMKIAFACPNHPQSAWMSKDPYSSSHFPQSSKTAVDCTSILRCKINVGDYVVTHEYKPTRNG